MRFPSPAMMSTQSPESSSTAKGRRSKLPSLNFGSSSASSPSASKWQPHSTASTSAASSNPSLAPSSSSSAMAGPDYFASAHGADNSNGAHASGNVRIASPFALPTPHQAPSISSTAATPGATLDQQSHPWAQLFGDGGMKTALPESFRASRFAVPPTPAVNKQSTSSSSSSGTTTTHHNPSLPLSASKKFDVSGSLKSGLMSSHSLPIPAASNRQRSPTGQDLSRYRGLNIDDLADALSPPSWASKHSPPASSQGSSSTNRLTSDDVLVLDIRPSTSFWSARIASSINICAPSTLLKRPAITVERIEDEMLSSASDRKRFMRWRKGPLKHQTDDAGQQDQSASSPESKPERSNTLSPPEEVGVKKIIVLDTDTSRVDGAGNATAGGGGPCLIGVLRKFEAAGFAGELCWLVGGFNRLMHSSKAKHFIDTGAPDQNKDVIDDEELPAASAETDSKSSPAKPPQLNLDGLKPSMSNSPVGRSDSADSKRSLVQPRGLPLEAFQSQSTVAGWPGQAQPELNQNKGDSLQPPMAPNGSQRQSKGLNTAASGARVRASSHQRPANACANPFFDNIRQNRELQHGITEKIPMQLPSMSEAQVNALPGFMRHLVRLPDDERAHILAQGFFDVEKAEQNRLISTMQQHSAQSEQDPRSNKDFASAQAAAMHSMASSHVHAADNGDGGRDRSMSDASSHAFPFSIAAALERGADNRYNNIWTYEHSRVKLHSPQNKDDPGSDYLNGSFVQPAEQIGSKRRYIATQAPLPTTFAAFWTAVWEQNSRVIVMLTREHESGRIQSHPYWLQTEYGPKMRVEKVEEIVMDETGKVVSSEDWNGVVSNDSDKEGGALFPLMAPMEEEQSTSSKGKPTTIRRTFRLRNLKEPNAPPRKVVQLQYIAWPDYHIPETPDSLLNLMDLADESQNAADAEMRQADRGTAVSEPLAGPMVVHCSAGVGRTGAFIVINAALDVIRRCRRRTKGQGLLAPWDCEARAASAANGSPEVDMGMLSPRDGRSQRTTRRSLKRELSPTGMDIDSNGSQLGRDLSSPPPMLRTRSNEGHDNSSGSHSFGSSADQHGSSWSSTASATSVSGTGATPSRDLNTMHLSSSAESNPAQPAAGNASANGFQNPFSSATFRFNPNAGGIGGRVGASMGSNSPTVRPASSGSNLTGNGADSGLGNENLTIQSPPRHIGAGVAGEWAWRSHQASSPFSEISTPSFHSGSARSSFSSAAGPTPASHSRLSSAGGLSTSTSESSRSIDGALAGMNPFEFTLSQSSLQQLPQSHQFSGDMDEEDLQGKSPAGRGAAAMEDTSMASTVTTGSNEPTPFMDARSSASAFDFSGHSSTGGRDDELSASASHSSSSTSTHQGTATSNTADTSDQEAHDGSVGDDGASNEEQVLPYVNGAAPTSVDTGSSGGVTPNKRADTAYADGQDIIRTIVDTAREQRMSLIQTGRQYVFVYSAVLSGLLRDLRAEGIY